MLQPFHPTTIIHKTHRSLCSLGSLLFNQLKNPQYLPAESPPPETRPRIIHIPSRAKELASLGTVPPLQFQKTENNRVTPRKPATPLQILPMLATIAPHTVRIEIVPESQFRTLLGAFTFGYNAAMVLHKLGHAFTVWMTGGTVTGFSLHPFSWSYTYYRSPPSYPLLTAWGGVLFSSAVALLLLPLIRPWRSAWTIPLAFTALCVLVVNGLYLTVDSLLLPGGDATVIIRHGTPWLFVLATGIALTLVGLVVALLILPRIGLTPDDTLVSRIVVLQAGVGPYLIAMLVYQVFWGRGELTLWATYVATGLLILAALAVGSWSIDKRWTPSFRFPPVTPSWSTALACLAAGTTVLVAEMMTFTR